MSERHLYPSDDAERIAGALEAMCEVLEALINEVHELVELARLDHPEHSVISDGEVGPC